MSTLELRDITALFCIFLETNKHQNLTRLRHPEDSQQMGPAWDNSQCVLQQQFTLQYNRTAIGRAIGTAIGSSKWEQQLEQQSDRKASWRLVHLAARLADRLCHYEEDKRTHSTLRVPSKSKCLSTPPLLVVCSSSTGDLAYLSMIELQETEIGQAASQIT